MHILYANQVTEEVLSQFTRYGTRGCTRVSRAVSVLQHERHGVVFTADSDDCADQFACFVDDRFISKRRFTARELNDLGAIFYPKYRRGVVFTKHRIDVLYRARQVLWCISRADQFEAGTDLERTGLLNMDFRHRTAFAYLEKVHVFLVAEHDRQPGQIVGKPRHGQRIWLPGVYAKVVNGR